MLRLADSRDVAEAVCLRNEETNEWDITRSTSIAIPMMEYCLAWIFKYDIESLEVCIESPVYNNNAKVLMMQMSLFTIIQLYVYDYLVPHLKSLYLTVVNNTTSKKKLAHDGKATKEAMIKASPWAGRKDISYNQKHTLADAFAHSLSADAEQHKLHLIEQYAVEANYEGR